MGCFASCRISTDKHVARSLCHSRASCTKSTSTTRTTCCGHPRDNVTRMLRVKPVRGIPALTNAMLVRLETGAKLVRAIFYLHDTFKMAAPEPIPLRPWGPADVHQSKTDPSSLPVFVPVHSWNHSMFYLRTSLSRFRVAECGLLGETMVKRVNTIVRMICR